MHRIVGRLGGTVWRFGGLKEGGGRRRVTATACGVRGFALSYGLFL